MDAIEKLYELENVEVCELTGDGLTGYDLPAPPPWIDQNITCDQVAAILEGGCASGAYADAAETMAEHGDAVLDYLQDRGYSTALLLRDGIGSWKGLACKVLSAAVEAWAHDVGYAIEDAG